MSRVGSRPRPHISRHGEPGRARRPHGAADRVAADAVARRADDVVDDRATRRACRMKSTSRATSSPTPSRGPGAARDRRSAGRYEDERERSRDHRVLARRAARGNASSAIGRERRDSTVLTPLLPAVGCDEDSPGYRLAGSPGRAPTKRPSIDTGMGRRTADDHRPTDPAGNKRGPRATAPAGRDDDLAFRARMRGKEGSCNVAPIVRVMCGRGRAAVRSARRRCATRQRRRRS
jgi:hypothetical protein